MNDPLTILIVDDDPDFAESTGSFLESRGHRVTRARDSDEGIELARAIHPDVIVMDVMMKERTEGFFAIQEIRRIEGLSDVPVFAVSAIYTTEPGFDVPPDTGWLAHDEFFAKPVDLDELVRHIETRTAERLRARESGNA